MFHPVLPGPVVGRPSAPSWGAGSGTSAPIVRATRTASVRSRHKAKTVVPLPVMRQPAGPAAASASRAARTSGHNSSAGACNRLCRAGRSRPRRAAGCLHGVAEMSMSARSPAGTSAVANPTVGQPGQISGRPSVTGSTFFVARCTTRPGQKRPRRCRLRPKPASSASGGPRFKAVQPFQSRRRVARPAGEPPPASMAARWIAAPPG